MRSFKACATGLSACRSRHSGGSCERACLFTLLALLTTCCIFSQTPPPPAFEAASVKPNTTGSGNSSTHGDKGQIVFTNASLRRLIERAYSIRPYQFTGPDWINNVNFDITARYPADTAKDQRALMLQTLLAQRFHLVIHRETKEMAAYALVVAKSGLKLETAAPAGHTSSTRGRFEDEGISMADLADQLARQVDHPVVDKTGLTGTYSLKLEWTPDDATGDSAIGPSIFTALQEQLGLKMQTQKLPVEMIVIDSVDRTPVEN